MHMANELLSVPVATSTLLIAAAGLGFVCKKARQAISSEKMALMGIMGAFIFAAQMINFQLPVMPGTSGHMVGAVLLAIILGPHRGAIVISSVVIIQCLIFQDGGLLALGCNIINMGLVPSYLGYFLYKSFTRGALSSVRTYVGTMLGCVLAIEVGAVLVVIQTVLSGVLVVPFSAFLTTMLGVHLLVGFAEGVITVAVLGYIQQVRPDIVSGSLVGKVRLSKKSLLTTFAVFAIIIASGLSLFACGFPDGLEWSYAERPDQPDFETIVSNNNFTVSKIDDFQSRYSLLPDYSIRTSEIGKATEGEINVAAGWTSLAGIVGAVLTMTVIWLTAQLLRRKQSTNILGFKA